MADRLTPPFSVDEWTACIKVLRALAQEPALNPDVDLMKGLVTKLYRGARKERRRAAKIEQTSSDREVLESTLRCRKESLTSTPALPVGEEAAEISRAIGCYVCKRPFRKVDRFYHLLCPECAEVNHTWRVRRTDLRGRRALVTGGRIKIGYETALKLLRDGAEVLVTTRFPCDAARRFASEWDFVEWRDRIRIVQLDLLDLPRVEKFAEYVVSTEPHLDILINNAAQTIRRPAEYFAALAAAEIRDTLPDRAEALLLRLDIEPGPMAPLQPVAFDGEPLDLRSRNSWVLGACEVETAELLEVHLVGAFAPFILNARLRPLFCRSPFATRFVVNVSAMEGQFGRKNKTERHPHTNMAKAALNMLTRTSAVDFAKDCIYMNSVDTGWVTNENPYPMKREQRESGFVPPLDVIDGASRIYAPIISGIEGTPVFGKFIKNYAEHEW